MRVRSLSAEVNRQRHERTTRLTQAVRSEFPEVSIVRFRAMLERIGYEKYPNERLRRSRGLRWSWFGEVFEEEIANLKILWQDIRRFAQGEIAQINHLIQHKASKGLVNAYGQQVPGAAAGGPRAFGEPEIATDIRLIPKGGKQTDEGFKYTDRGMVSSSASEAGDRWQAFSANIEIKVPKKAWKFGKQSAEAIPRIADAAYVKYTIVDDAGQFVREETVAVERVVFNPASTNRIGISTTPSGIENWRIVEGRARGHKEVHLRIDVAVGTRRASTITKLLFAERILRRGAGK